MKATRIYGFTHDYGSYAQVTRGFAEAFRLGGAEVDVVSLEEERTFEEEPAGSPLAPVAILTGPPIAAERMLVGSDHAKRLVMVAPNSSRLPERTMATVNRCATMLLAPSKWAATVVSEYTTLPVVVAPHGVSHNYRPVDSGTDLAKLYEEGVFRILHLSSTGGERKGTNKLVEAFLEALDEGTLPQRAELKLVLAPQAHSALLDMIDISLGWKQIQVMSRLGQHGAAPEAMSRIFGMVHVVCQPSRGEGFGMVPLEALAAGTPIVATAATGHSEWFVYELPGAIRVATGAAAPIDDMGGAEAPSLEVADVKDALRRAYEQWYGLKAEAIACADATRKLWSWPLQLGSLVRLVNE